MPRSTVQTSAPDSGLNPNAGRLSTANVLAGDILASLSLEQKVAMLHQHAPAVPELGLESFHTGAEAAHGVAWLGPATVFPQPVGMAATWDADLIERLGEATGRELRGKKAEDSSVGLNVWAPVVNPLRHPLWGRNEEGFSEDPHLTAELAGAYCRGLKGQDPHTWLTVPTLKHFLGYNNEFDRNVSSSNLSPRVLHEYELPAYRSPIEAGVAGAVMLSYNLVNGRPAHVSDLVQSQLRQWRNGDALAVVSDAGAPGSLFRAEKYFNDGPAAYAAALQAGVDSFTDDGDNPAPSIAYLTEALEQGLINESDVDRAVLRLLTLRARTGEFTNNPYASIGAEEICAAAHVQLAREAAARSVVLLRNDADAGLLPLGGTPGTIAVIGSLGARVLTDWYSGTLQNAVSIADGLGRRYSGTAGANVVTEEGVDVVALRSVRTGGYLGGAAGAVLTATAAAPGMAESFTLKDWGAGEVTLQSMLTGKFVTDPGDGYLRAEANRVGGWVVQETFRLDYAADGTAALQHVGTGKWLRIESGTNSAALVLDAATAERFVLRTLKSGHEAARKAAAEAHTAVVVVGNDPHLGGRETLDRSTLELPLAEQELVRVVREANPRTILLIVSSYPYALGTLADTPAIVWTSHGGQELGSGVADVLSGDIEPSGRLAQTWFARDADLPDILDYDIITSRSTYVYSRAEPLFPLGHGLTYSDVKYQSIALREMPGGGTTGADVAELTVEVRNEGTRPAFELVQVYASAPGHRFEFPRRLLVGHQRVAIPAGGTATATIAVPLDRLATYSVVEERMLVEPGIYQLLAGASAENLPLALALDVPGTSGAWRPTGQWFRAVNFDTCSNLALVPETRLHGTAIAPADAARPAWAIYRGWSVSGGTEDFELRVVVCSPSDNAGGKISVQVPRTADTWKTVGSASVPKGFSGELRVRLEGGTGATEYLGGVETLRLTLQGAVTVSTVQLR
ncbi:beta-glucosidase [Pseudarthrobacter sp. NamE5]|uniref:beta-glucosidase family protein n=1 Tax=Pseudarthrobacter sp. NamE5 TaxID=2576839 RepID=UPI00110A7C5B|nr:glycoside hydrolase family 3 C-terminal domain-containing protein [Pseudarthrobacter sp. NamE5]TLM82496.1 glycoside hydrolase family 3 protein [Pseudarthrobacter sp. NamE5]